MATISRQKQEPTPPSQPPEPPKWLAQLAARSEQLLYQVYLVRVFFVAHMDAWRQEARKWEKVRRRCRKLAVQASVLLFVCWQAYAPQLLVIIQHVMSLFG